MRFAALALAVVFAVPAAAQQPRPAAADPPEPPALGWEVTLGGAGGFGVNSSDMDRAMAEAGYGQTSGGTAYPQSSGDFLKASFFLSVRTGLGERFAVGISGGSTKLGSTTGYASGTFVTVGRSSAHVALVFFWRPIPGLRVGAGPGWYRASARISGGDEVAASRFGVVLEAGLAYPQSGRVYADLAVQYRGTGRVDFGTLAVPPVNGRPLAPIPLYEIGCEHWAFVAGVGFRF